MKHSNSNWVDFLIEAAMADLIAAGCANLLHVCCHSFEVFLFRAFRHGKQRAYVRCAIILPEALYFELSSYAADAA